jgi:hypothetical protein
LNSIFGSNGKESAHGSVRFSEKSIADPKRKSETQKGTEPSRYKENGKKDVSEGKRKTRFPKRNEGSKIERSKHVESCQIPI